MSLARKMARASGQRKKAAKGVASRPDRGAEPQRRLDRRTEHDARIAEQREWLASLTPEQRERYDRRAERRMQSLMEICAPALLGAVSLAARG